jgi:nuclear pore complex protein Nup98-Nup96
LFYAWSTVHFRHKEVVVYPDDEKKPEVGEGLNRRAQVTLDRVWPIDKTTREPISDPMRIAALDYESKLRIASAKHGTRFVEYRPQTGSWVFKVLLIFQYER